MGTSLRDKVREIKMESPHTHCLYPLYMYVRVLTKLFPGEALLTYGIISSMALFTN
jgi:hypothetical protein